MRCLLAAWIVLFANGVSALPADRAAGALDSDAWRYLPVQDDGRRKPLDTLARETLRRIAGRSGATDPVTGRKLESTALYLAIVFEWKGWDQPPKPHARGMTGAPATYFGSHRPDKWDRVPLLPVDHVALREALGMAKDHKYISARDLAEAKIRDPDTQQQMPFGSWVRKLYHDKQEDFNQFEKKALQLANKLSAFQGHRMGQGLRIIPVKGSKEKKWLSLANLMRLNFDDKTDPTGGLRKAQEQFRKTRAAYLAGSAEDFDEASAALIATLQEFGPQLGDYPDRAIIDLEVAYNRWVPFRFAWIFTLIAAVALVLSIGTGWKAAYIAGLTALGASLAAMLIGLGVRWVLKEWPPVTNLYESVVFTGFGTVLFGLVFGLWARRQNILAAAAVIATIILVLADFCPSALDPSLRPIPPVLRDDFWLVVHVMTIMLSYAALALALGLGNITLGFYLVGSNRREAIRTQSRFTYKLLQAGVLLLLLGTILGAAWADDSWGRFWSWDPKEVWALITLFGYLAILHARYAGWVGNRGLAAWSVVCFTLVLMTWYGVNFLSGGLHNYGLSGGEGPYYVLAVVGLQLLYAAAAILRSASRNISPIARPG